MKKPYLILLIGITVFIYFNSFMNDFVTLDDDKQVYENSLAQSLSLESLKKIAVTPVIGMYTPLTISYYTTIAYFFNVKSATPFHVFSFLIHLLNILLVYFLGIKIFKDKNKAFLLSALFSLHPSAVEAVSWVSATSTLLFSFFFLSALLYYIKFLELEKNKYYVFSLILFILGCFCKVQMIPFVGVLFLIEYLFEKPFLSKKYVLQKVPFIFVAFIFAFIATKFREVNTDPIGFSYSRVYFSLNQITWYITKLISPINLSTLYLWPKKLTFLHHFYAVITVSLIYLIYYFRKKRLVIFGGLFFLGNIILHTAIFSKITNPYAIRYLYLSSLGIWIVIITFFYEKRFLYVYAVFIVFLSFTTKKLTMVWENSISLYEHILELESNNEYAHSNLGLIYTASNPKKAEKHLLKAFSLSPKLVTSQNLSSFYIDHNNLKKAEKYLLHLSKLDPENAITLNNLGTVYKDSNPKKAEEYFLKASRIDPTFSKVFYNLGLINEKLNPKKAENYYLKVIKLSPENALVHRKLALLYNNTGDFKKSESYYLKAIELAPNNAIGYHNLAVLYMDSYPKKAEKYFLRTIEIDPNRVVFYINLGNLYIKLSEEEKAKKIFLKGLKISPKNKKVLDLLKLVK